MGSIRGKLLTLEISILITITIIVFTIIQLSFLYKQNTYSATISSNTPCITYNPTTRIIIIACQSAGLADIYKQIHDGSILSKQSTGRGTIWFLNARLLVAKGAALHIDPTDTRWLKISSSTGITATALTRVNNIDVDGSLKIDSVKITSWDPLTNNYATTNGSRHDIGVGKPEATVPGTPRPYITIEADATGTTDITNSEIAYLGYEKGSFSGIGTAGLNYYGGEGSILRGNNIHDLYFGFYSSGVGRFLIENNQIHHNTIYGLDPHTGTHDMIIRNNVVHDNGQFGIICSLNCNNITIENNEAYHDGNKNSGAGIMFSRNMINSVARNNNIHDEPSAGILISASHDNQIYNNTVSNSGVGISLRGSSNNRIHDNTFVNSGKGIDASADPGFANIIYNNHFIKSPFTTTLAGG